MLLTGSGIIDAERAFTRAARARRRAAIARSLRRGAHSAELAVFETPVRPSGGTGHRPGLREIPIDAILGTLEPARSRMFDACFRPRPAARTRWERVWMAAHRGVALPPVAVVQVGDGYALRDGHHRVSVARARGALTIDAQVDSVLR